MDTVKCSIFMCNCKGYCVILEYFKIYRLEHEEKEMDTWCSWDMMVHYARIYCIHAV